MFQFKAKGREKPIAQLQGSWAIGVPLALRKANVVYFIRSSSDWMGSPTLGRATCFTQSTNSNINLVQKHPHTPRIMSEQMSEHPVAQSNWHLRTTIITLLLAGLTCREQVPGEQSPAVNEGDGMLTKETYVQPWPGSHRELPSWRGHVDLDGMVQRDKSRTGRQGYLTFLLQSFGSTCTSKFLTWH